MRQEEQSIDGACNAWLSSACAVLAISKTRGGNGKHLRDSLEELRLNSALSMAKGTTCLASLQERNLAWLESECRLSGWAAYDHTTCPKPTPTLAPHRSIERCHAGPLISPAWQVVRAHSLQTRVGKWAYPLVLAAMRPFGRAGSVLFTFSPGPGVSLRARSCLSCACYLVVRVESVRLSGGSWPPHVCQFPTELYDHYACERVRIKSSLTL